MKWTNVGPAQDNAKKGRWHTTVFRAGGGQKWTIWFCPIPFYSLIHVAEKKYPTLYGAKMAAERTLRGRHQ